MPYTDTPDIGTLLAQLAGQAAQAPLRLPQALGAAVGAASTLNPGQWMQGNFADIPAALGGFQQTMAASPLAAWQSPRQGVQQVLGGKPASTIDESDLHAGAMKEIAKAKQEAGAGYARDLLNRGMAPEQVETLVQNHFQQTQPQAPMMTPPTPVQTGAAIEQHPSWYQRAFGQPSFDPQTGKLVPQGWMSQIAGAGLKVLGAPTPMDQLAQAQEITGTQPMQSGDRERMGLEALNQQSMKQLELRQKMFERGTQSMSDLVSSHAADSKNFLEAQPSLIGIQAALSQPNNPEAWQSGMFHMAKLEFPGKAADIKTTQQAIPLLRRLTNAPFKMVNGLPDQQSQRQFTQLANAHMSQILAQQAKLDDLYRQQAAKQGYNPEYIPAYAGQFNVPVAQASGQVLSGSRPANSRFVIREVK